MNEILIKYFSARMLSTLDINNLFHCLFQQFGECNIRFVPMTLDEKNEASSEVDGISAVNERFWVFHCINGGIARKPEVEQKIIFLGQK